jgi:hypothetical protein
VTRRAELPQFSEVSRGSRESTDRTGDASFLARELLPEAGMRLSMLSILLAFASVAGCGSTPLGSAAGGGGAGGGLGGRAGGTSGQGGQTDGGDLACGDVRCQPSQICLYPAYGCVIVASPDAGVCPGGSEYADAAGACLDVPPAPSCVSPTPGQGSFDCSGADAGATCGTVNAPIPSGCSRICRSICA